MIFTSQYPLQQKAIKIFLVKLKEQGNILFMKILIDRRFYSETSSDSILYGMDCDKAIKPFSFS